MTSPTTPWQAASASTPTRTNDNVNQPPWLTQSAAPGASDPIKPSFSTGNPFLPNPVAAGSTNDHILPTATPIAASNRSRLTHEILKFENDQQKQPISGLDDNPAGLRRPTTGSVSSVVHRPSSASPTKSPGKPFDPFDDQHASRSSLSVSYENRGHSRSHQNISIQPADMAGQHPWNDAGISGGGKSVPDLATQSMTEWSSTLADIGSGVLLAPLKPKDDRMTPRTSADTSTNNSSRSSIETNSGAGVKDLARAFNGLAASNVPATKFPLQHQPSLLHQPSAKVFPGWVTFEDGVSEPSKNVSPGADPESSKPAPPAAKPRPIVTTSAGPEAERIVLRPTPIHRGSLAGIESVLPPPPSTPRATSRKPLIPAPLIASNSPTVESPVGNFMDKQPSLHNYHGRVASMDEGLTNSRLSIASDPFGDEHHVSLSADSSDDDGASNADNFEETESEKARLAFLEQPVGVHSPPRKTGNVAALAQNFASPTASKSPGRVATSFTHPDDSSKMTANLISPRVPNFSNTNPFVEDMHSAPVRTPTLPPTHFESDITRSATTPASPKRPPLPPRPTSPGDRQAALRRATSPVAIYPLIKTKTVSEPSVAPPLIPLRPHARAVEEAVESYVASTTTPDIPSLDGKYTGLRGGEKTYSPDTVHTNRRPPLAEHLPNTDIYLKTPPRCFAISGFYACSGSEKIRVWYIPTGENIRTISVGEMKMYAFAFPPTLYVEDEGRYLWVALEKGEIIEVDISVGEIVDRRSLHSATVTHMMRYHGQLWTLDENGALKIWSVDPERQRVSLQQRPRGVRVSGKQTVAFAANDRLWTAAGKVIEVYHPMGDMSSCFQQRFEISMTAGQVTCFAATRDGTIVFSGHDDGKITVWDAVHLVKKRVITAGMYRVTSLLGVGSEYLWAGFSTGKIYIYDVRKIDGGWTAVKEFSAYHSNSVDEMLIDDRSVFLSGYLHIASLSENGQVRIWDGFMLRDWQERQLQLRESEMCTYREVSVLVCSWNLDATKPAELEESRSPEDNGFLQRWLSQVDQPDILVVGFQELVDLESKKVTAKNLLKGGKKSQQSHIDQRFKLWQDALIKVVQQAQPRARYHVLSCRQLVGLFQCVLLKESEVLRVKDLSAISVKTGLGGYHGNKGGIATRFVIDDSSFCFVNCHLAAHQNQVSARNNDTATILKDAQFPAKPEYHGIFVGGGDGTVILDHENVFWSGDLNYRIDLPRERVLELIDQQDWSALQENDQLIRQMITNPSFGLRGFSEGALTFAPTFKYDIGKDRYDSSEKRRVPSWCDRILYRGPDIRQHFYNRYPPSISDHRPIAAAFSIRVKSVDQNRLPAVKQEVEVKRQQYLASLLESEKMLWLKDCAGCSYEEAQAALAEASGDLRLARDRADVLRVQSSLA